ncbi:Zinc metalloprotease Rip1 [Corynebacterium capitovis DSM 44611]|uniref:M50 family metallopeptidase n=1 Tax=Corynebacterium capitovis TaxID=131081 RepID=UPI00036D0CB4|nr:M50 family metallopeptidase [Corynebacterium capitovis]WKD57458.1 Zinc metalloprotease Rip1 [Corynebacterium capitovis DSM 44611]
MAAVGVLLFALGIAATIALHEAGHMIAARSCGMHVRRFFVGFGPPIWQLRRGGTTYGVAALPFGGFCDIAGMTPQDPLTAEERPRAMYRKPWWQRVIVMVAGVVVNLFLGFMIIYCTAATAAVPNPYADFTPTVGKVSCTSDQVDHDTLSPCEGTGPAGKAGIMSGDRILAVDGHPVRAFTEIRAYVQERPGATIALKVERDGAEIDVPVVVDTVVRLDPSGQRYEAGAIGVSSRPVADATKRFGPLEAVPASLRLSAQMLGSTVEGIASFPAKIPGVVASVFGAQRDEAGPVSVIGASRAGGELAERNMWVAFWMMLASLNFFLALFNLVPLPPLDGGHIAVIVYEKLRDGVRRARGLAPGGAVDYRRLMPLTYALAAALLIVGAIVMVADVVNPVRVFG